MQHLEVTNPLWSNVLKKGEVMKFKNNISANRKLLWLYIHLSSTSQKIKAYLGERKIGKLRWAPSTESLHLNSALTFKCSTQHPSSEKGPLHGNP